MKSHLDKLKELDEFKDDANISPELFFEISCRHVILPVSMDLLSIRQLIWKAIAKPAPLQFDCERTSDALPPLASNQNSNLVVLEYRLRDLKRTSATYLNQPVRMKPAFQMKLDW